MNNVLNNLYRTYLEINKCIMYETSITQMLRTSNQ